MTDSIDLWMTCGSTYTYLTIMDLAADEARHDVRFNLRPFYLGAIFNDLGRWPFPDDNPKTAYMWHDIARRAEAKGLNVTLPAPYPAPQTVRANQIAHVALKEDWGRDYLIASYTGWFEHGLKPGEDDNIAYALNSVGQDPSAITAAAEDPAVHAYLEAETATAKALGVFGAPTFAVGHELFWGSDRAADAVTWLRNRS